MAGKGTRTPSGLLIRGNSSGGGGGGGGPTQPSDLVSLVGWWDASDAASIVSAGGKVSQWNNKKAGGVHAVQATGTAQPTTGTRTMNGKNVIDFQGDDTLELVTNPCAGAAAGTVLVAFADDADPSVGVSQAGAPLGGWGSSASGTHMPYTDGTCYDTFGSSSQKALGNLPGSLVQSRVYSVVSAAGDWRAYQDGVSVFTTATNVVGWSAAPGIGTGRPTDVFLMDGIIGEIIVCNTALSNTDRQAMEAYLTAKWNGPIAATAWSPAALPNLVGWFDASDAASIVSAGGKVSQWSDKSGANRHATQGTAGSQPVTGTRTINGLNALEYPDTGRFLDAAFVLGTASSTLLVVFKADNVIVASRLVSTNKAGGADWNTPDGCSWLDVASHQTYWNNVAVATTAAAFTTATPFLVEVIRAGTAWTITSNGTAGTSAASAATASNPDKIRLGGVLPSGSGHVGVICEVIVGNVAWSGADLTNARDYLKTKWGTP